MTVTTSDPTDLTDTSLKSALLGQSTRFDLAVALAGLWMITGVFIDGWAHANLPETEETFFTPWHGVLYSGFFAAAAIITFVVFYNFMITGNLRTAVPRGYGYALLGVMIFFSGGIGDMLWHTFIGIETDIEALFSPTHLTLMFGAFLIATGVLRKASFVPDQFENLKSQAALIISAVGGIAIIIFFTQFSHPYRSTMVTQANATGDFSYIRDGQLFMGFIWHAALLAGFVYYVFKNFETNAGMMGALVAVPLLLTTILEPTFFLIPAALLAGVGTAGLYSLARRSDQTLVKRLFGGAVTLLVFGLYYLNMAISEGIGWSLELWSGSLVVVTLVGILVSFVFYPLEE